MYTILNQVECDAMMHTGFPVQGKKIGRAHGQRGRSGARSLAGTHNGPLQVQPVMTGVKGTAAGRCEAAGQ